MPPVTEIIDIRTSAREQTLDVTQEVADAIRRSGVSSGLAVVYTPHTTTGLIVQENADPTVKSDLLNHLRKLVPKDPAFEHDEGNADAHIKSALVGVSTTLIVDGGRPQLGHWQGVFFCEFDGPRARKLMIRVLAG